MYAIFLYIILVTKLPLHIHLPILVCIANGLPPMADNYQFSMLDYNCQMIVPILVNRIQLVPGVRTIPCIFLSVQVSYRPHSCGMNEFNCYLLLFILYTSLYVVCTSVFVLIYVYAYMYIIVHMYIWMWLDWVCLCL